MKRFSIYLIVASMTIAFWSCEKKNNVIGPIPFQFKFYSIGLPAVGDASCGVPPVVMSRQEGAGSNKFLGEFIFVSQFCSNGATGEYFGGPSAFGYFEDSKGDRLNVISEGQVIPSTKEGYDLMFQDPIEIIGGTGRFEGATGSGMSDSYVILEEGRTDHIWTGTLYLRKNHK